VQGRVDLDLDGNNHDGSLSHGMGGRLTLRLERGGESTPRMLSGDWVVE
jgi:hypothetical protein